ncbi:hypothetical protein O0L34_g13696 [Tuta absoluta]|nr:hypothetical protein O0L34_g14158 [Tuta absoluta]KAJ2951547.1 hypothetical protein O0L34_g13696 [Tuta absoluta]
MNVCPECNELFEKGARCGLCASVFCFKCANISSENYDKLRAPRLATLRCAPCLAGKSNEGRKTHDSQDQSAFKEAQIPPMPNHPHQFELILKSINDKLAVLPTLTTGVTELQNKFMILNESLGNLQTNVQGLASKVNDFETRIDVLEAEDRKVSCDCEFRLVNLEEKLLQLQTHANDKDQRARLNNVEIKGVPQKKDENLISFLLRLGSKLNMEITPGNINFITRIRSRTSQEKPIIACFTNRYVKENFVAAARKLKCLAAVDLGFAEDQRIYINDHLTPENKDLLNRTKKIADELNYKYVWVNRCRILVRKSDTSPIFSIQCLSDLNKLK